MSKPNRTILVTTYWPPGADRNGGQQGIRLTCVETGRVVECHRFRTQHQNYAEAKRLMEMEP